MPRVTWTISLPPAFEKEADELRKREHRTRSEFVREAIRTYIAERTYAPIASERRAIEKGRAATRRGDTLTLEQARAYVDRQRPKASTPKRRSRTASRA